MKKTYWLVPLVLFSVVALSSCTKVKDVACGAVDSLPFCDQTLKNADAAMAAGNCASALPLYNQYLAGKPAADKIPMVKGKISECYFTMGEDAFKAGKFADAIGFYSQCEKPEAKGKVDACNLALGDAALAAGDFPGAIVYYSKVTTPEGQAKLSEVAFQQGEAAMKENNCEAAIEFYTKSQKPEAKTRMEECYIILGDAAMADKDYDKAIEYFTLAGDAGKEKLAAAEKAKKGGGAAGPAWAINARTFSDKADAQATASELKSAGLPAYVAGGANAYVVWVGPYGSAASAENGISRLKTISKKQYRGAFVKKIR